MTKLIADKEQKEIALMSVTKYVDFEHYKEDWEDLESAKEDFADKLEKGFIQEITLGTYNGTLDIFTPRKIDDSHILDAIFTDLHETDSYAMLNEIEETESMTQADYIRAYSELYTIFVIGEKIYIDRD